ncbi:hypothetical protein J2738_000012 [Variovorax paradoxus]|uniref:DUF4390 domain-containing protein n=1 Tax=Variovorax paradoxus TaxID=34073 RepID=A0AAE4BVX2_VARPD|nr:MULTISPECIES: DUF4390 domain-containing protein [Variovorax]MBD9666614.1 DUF4390 domain-containing protein [Variovorax sp. VRV01]MDR6423890.1 hypothetical protein [Variovorax paradoxus]MDR6452836.1 hypothetical protein [Variovorax paradoxus]
MKNVRAEARRRRILAPLAGLLLAWALLLTCLLPIAVAQGRVVPSVTQMRLEQADDGVYLTAAVQFELPSLVEEVLDKGIAIYFVAEAEVFQERWYWTDRKVAQVTRHMRLAYQPLTRRWRLNVSPVPITGAAGFGVSLNQNFDSLADAMDAVKRVGRLRLGDAAEVGDEPLHQVVFRFRLDTSQLPRPFQIGVVGQADWNIVAERSAKLALEKQR